MPLSEELSFRKPLVVLEHEVLLNIYHTASCLKKEADEFFRQYSLTDVQFNLLMLLRHQSSQGGLSQADISQMMLVNRANITALVDRMEKAGLVQRTADPNDRRTNIIVMTDQGREMLNSVESVYIEMVKNKLVTIDADKQRQLIEMLEKIRQNIRAVNDSCTQRV